MNKGLAIAVAVLVGGLVLLVVGFWFASQRERVGLDGDVPAVSPTQAVDLTPTQSSGVADPSPTIQVAVPDDWQRYANEDVGFLIHHPDSMEIESNPVGGVKFQMEGPTQRQGTELYDGISLTIQRGSFEAGSFDAFVQNEYVEEQDSPTNSGLSELRERTMLGRRGYEYVVTGLGEFTHVYLPLEGKRYAHIYYLVEDPEGDDFAQILSDMLSTLEFTDSSEV